MLLVPLPNSCSECSSRHFWELVIIVIPKLTAYTLNLVGDECPSAVDSIYVKMGVSE